MPIEAGTYDEKSGHAPSAYIMVMEVKLRKKAIN